MTLPDIKDLDAIVDMIGQGMTFDQLGPDTRMKVLQIYAQLDVGDAISELTAIVKDIEVDTTKMGEWFAKSKLWEGRLT